MTGFTEQERNAMRAYLQRAEVRLSAMDRVATAFISGAGLLVLFPIFFRGYRRVGGDVRIVARQPYSDGLTIYSFFLLHRVTALRPLLPLARPDAFLLCWSQPRVSH